VRSFLLQLLLKDVISNEISCEELFKYTENHLCWSSLKCNLNSNILTLFKQIYKKYKLYKIDVKGDLKMRKKKYLRNIGVLLTDKQYERLVQITDEREVIMSEYIREIVKEKIGHKNDGQK